MKRVAAVAETGFVTFVYSASAIHLVTLELSAAGGS